MPIVISSKREGFRRCGVAHSKAATEHADDAFTEEQLAVLEADPMLTVVVAIAVTPKPEDMTVSALTALLTKLEVEIPKGSKKPDLVKLVYDNTKEPPPED
ncbi:MAG: HI1506-related protein [Pseudomonadota bacterium]